MDTQVARDNDRLVKESRSGSEGNGRALKEVSVGFLDCGAEANASTKI